MHELNLLVIIVIIITIGIMYFVFDSISELFRANPIWLLFVFLSIAFVSMAYVFTTISVDIYTTRYLIFPQILGLSILALGYNKTMKQQTKKKKIAIQQTVEQQNNEQRLTKHQQVYLFLLLSLIIINAGSNTEFLMLKNQQSNQEQHELIDYLKESNLTNGFGNYWDSNIITYLSREEVVIKPIIFTNEGVAPFRWLSCERWFKEETKTSEFFIIESHFQNGEIDNFVLRNPPKKTIGFKGYKIHVWDVNK